MELGRIQQDVQGAGEELWAHVQEWDALGRTADEFSPWSFPPAK